jgi:hypothetical protein
MPVSYPTAFNVSETLTVTEFPLVKLVPLIGLGVLPSVVYQIVAPDVVVLIVTVCGT